MSSKERNRAVQGWTAEVSLTDEAVICRQARRCRPRRPRCGGPDFQYFPGQEGVDFDSSHAVMMVSASSAAYLSSGESLPSSTKTRS